VTSSRRAPDRFKVIAGAAGAAGVRRIWTADDLAAKGLVLDGSDGWAIRAEGVRFERSSAFRLTAHPGEIRVGAGSLGVGVLFGFVERGTVSLHSGASPERLGPGQAFFLQPRADLVVQWPLQTLLTVAKVPPSVLADHGAVLPLECGRLLAHRSVVTPVKDFVAAVSEAEAPEPSSGRRIERLLEEMTAALALEHKAALPCPRAGRDLYAAALALIDARKGDRRLTPASIAASLNVSLRHLQREFSQRGDAVATAIRRLRTEYARELLRDPRFASATSPGIAELAGFGSAKSLHRALMDSMSGGSPRDVSRPIISSGETGRDMVQDELRQFRPEEANQPQPSR
jgi:AraC-like DNA-binding protein